MKVLFIRTGGTIDKDYFQRVKSYSFLFGTPAAATVLGNVDLGFEYEIIDLMQKDSLDMTNNDRLVIKTACMTPKYDKIIITHGTDTVVETAAVVGELPDKTIIFTGAIVPEKVRGSDAAFNIGVAVGAINCLPAGTYIAMNGQIHKYDNVQKCQETGRFVKRK